MIAYVEKKNCTAARLPVFLSIRCLSHTPLSVSPPQTHTHTHDCCQFIH